MLHRQASSVRFSDRYALVGITNPSAVEIVDLRDRRVLRTIPLQGGIPWSIAVSPDGRDAFVTESSWPSPSRRNDVVEIDLSTDRVVRSIEVGEGPVAIAVSSRTNKAYVVNMGTTRLSGGRQVVVDDYTVTPVDIATGVAAKAIEVCPGPGAIALTPDQSEAFVACTGTPQDPSHEVVPIDLSTGVTGAPISAGVAPMAVAVTHDGRKLFIANTGWPAQPDDTVTVVDLTTDRILGNVSVGLSPISIAITPDDRTAFVVNNAYSQGSVFTVTPIDVATDTPGKPITVGPGPVSVAIAPDGKTAYVSNMGASTESACGSQIEVGDTITPIDVTTLRVGPAIRVDGAPAFLTFLPVGART